MKFILVDRISEIEAGRRVVAQKALSLAEEYLADHFPKFPVLPGVLMLEAMVQASAWLVHASQDFAHSMVLLKRAQNVKYSDFVSPGQTLSVTAEIIAQDERETKLKATGTADGETKVGGRLVLERYNLADTQPDEAGTDRLVRRELRKLFALLYPGHPAVPTPG